MISKLNGKYVGFPCTPSRWTGNPLYEKITVLTMTCGGGMGGSKWKEYVLRVKNIPSNTTQEYTTLDGKKIKLNSAYLVKAEDFTLVKIGYETSNSNFYPENNVLGNAVPYKKWVPKQCCFLIEDGQEVILIDEFASVAKRRNNIEGWE